MHKEKCMPLLQVRDFPEDVYDEISMVARKEHRTIAQQALVLIQKGLGKEETNKERRMRLIEKCNARVISDEIKAIDDAALIREDRGR
jgi:hypothetical protein